MYFAIDNFWLYEYHETNYTWLTTQMFEIARLLEEKKSEIVNPENFSFVQDSVNPSFTDLSDYSDDKYVEVEQKDRQFFRNAADFFIVSVPYCLIVFFLFNRLFYVLYNYEISSYIRIFSFWGFLYQMIIESNVEWFVFLGARYSKTMFSFNFGDKMWIIGFSLFFYIVFAGSICSYFLFYYFYDKLSKYFMTNVFRIKGAFLTMTFIYGIRPFIKGAIHAYLSPYN